MQNNLSNKSPCYAPQGFFKVSYHTEIQNIQRFYLIKIKNFFANFGQEKQFKVKKKLIS